MYSRIVVPLDGTPFGRIALRHAAAIARHARADIELVHVHIPEHLESDLFDLTPFHFTGVVPADDRLDRRRLKEEVEQLEEEAIDLCRSTGVAVTSRTLAGAIDAAIEEEARTFGADLIVMATHDARSTRAVLGSVGRAVLRRASVPVLLVHPSGSIDPGDSLPEVRHIIVALDGSLFSEQALAPAGDLARLFGSTIHLLYVDVPLRTRIPEEMLRAIYASGAPEATGQAYLREVARMFEPVIGEAQVEVIAADSAAPAILDAVERSGADLLAMATHGRGGIRRMVIGSTADEVLGRARGPVLLFRPGRGSDRESILESAAAAHTVV